LLLQHHPNGNGINIFRTHDHKGSVAPLYLATLMYITGRYQSCLDVIIECNKRVTEGFLQVVYVSVNLQLTVLRLELELQIHCIRRYVWCYYILEVVCSYINGNFTDPCLYCYLLQISKGILGPNQLQYRIYGENKQTLQNILELLFNDKFYGLHRCQSVDLPYSIFQVLINEKRSIVVSVGESRYVTETLCWLLVCISQSNTVFMKYEEIRSSISSNEPNTCLRYIFKRP
jgi:hypothetical protein